MLGLEPDRVQQLVGHPLLRLTREMPREHMTVLTGRRGGRDERDELRLQPAEDALELHRGQAGLVVVEQDVVRVRELPRAVEARDVASLKLEYPLERGREVVEVALLARLQPGLLGVRVGAGDLRREVGRDLDRLVVIPAQDPHEAGVVGVGVDGGRPRLQRVQQLGEPGIGEAIVLDPLQRLELVRPRPRPARRHHRVLVPQQQAPDPVEVGDLARTAA